MKLYYISTAEHAKKIPHEWHGIELEDGRLLVCVRWKDECEEMHWSNHPAVHPLPHPILESTVPIEPDHVTILSRRLLVEPGHTVLDVIREVSKIHPLMRLHVL